MGVSRDGDQNLSNILQFSMRAVSTTGAGRQNELTEINAWEQPAIGAGRKLVQEKQPSAKPGTN